MHDQRHKSSPFLSCGPIAQADDLAVLYLRRDHSIPATLRDNDAEADGYEEGKVVNTRFGSFPHSTLIGLPWGSQVRASKVDTGSRGRKIAGQKRKRPADEAVADETAADSPAPGKELKAAVQASSGFIHLLPPTPELWTASLPHRTQVVYTPDYSFIIQRLGLKPDSVLIEAGAGSGSFTHAAARAVFSGYPQAGKPGGKVWSYEFHEPRADALRLEVTEHGLDQVVTVTHRDVCEHGFGIKRDGDQIVQATAIFLDLPAPWLALKHFSRQTSSPIATRSCVPICCFLPCIEQVHKAISGLKATGWVEVSVVELQSKRMEVRRERIGLNEEGLRGVNASPATVEEAVGRLREVEERTRLFHAESTAKERGEKLDEKFQEIAARQNKAKRLRDLKDVQEDRKLFKEGKLTTRSEPELKTHTSYLVFAVLPAQWTEEDEAAACRQWQGHKRKKT